MGRASRKAAEKLAAQVKDAMIDWDDGDVVDWVEMFDTALREFAASQSGLRCDDCGRRYGDEYGFPDLILPDDIWDAISGGLLCPSCIVARCVQHGLSNIPVVWTSGPFVLDAEDSKEE